MFISLKQLEQEVLLLEDSIKRGKVILTKIIEKIGELPKKPLERTLLICGDS